MDFVADCYLQHKDPLEKILTSFSLKPFLTINRVIVELKTNVSETSFVSITRVGVR
jgi:hypothetical protein